MRPLLRLWAAVVLALFFSTAYASSAAAPGGVLRGAVNVNTATAEELDRLPGIGPKRAQDIVAYREKHPFLRLSQLQRIKGIGPELFKKIQPYVKLDGPTDLRWEPDDKKGP